jgi:hypothetical protein
MVGGLYKRGEEIGTKWILSTIRMNICEVVDLDTR